MLIARSYPRFGRLLAALATSQLGDWLYNLSLLAFVEQRTHSTAWLGITTAARIGPMVLGAPIGGLIADRFDRRRLMFASDALRAAIMGALVLIAVAGLPIALVPVLAAAATVAGVAYPPSVAAITPRLVEARHLAGANAARAAIGPACIAAGPALGAVLLLIGPPPVAFAINAVTFIASGLLIASIPAGPAFVRSPRPRHDDRVDDGVRALVNELREGARALKAAPEAGWMVSADVAGSLVYGAQTVLLLLVAVRLHLGAGGYGYLLAAQGLGGIAGASLAGRLGPVGGRRSTLAAALVMVALPLPILAITTNAAVAIAIGIVGGAGALIVEVVVDTRLQQTLDESRLGCAYGFAFAASVGGIALGGLIAPVLVSIAGVGGALYVLAAAVLTLAAAIALRGATLAYEPALSVESNPSR
ncbi:MAG TPA: MFS transporter [Solirubrobacteraceae bacterium]|nr:MFS transporter [Solirubrobacteraceae bacterium]